MLATPPALAAHAQGKYTAMHHALMEATGPVTPQTIHILAATTGLILSGSRGIWTLTKSSQSSSVTRPSHRSWLEWHARFSHRRRGGARNCEISVRTAMSLEIESMVAEGRVDFGLVVREPHPATPGCLHIVSLPLYCVLLPSHPMAQGSSVEMADIAKLPYVSLGRQFTVGGVAARMLASIGERYSPAVEVMHFSTACASVKHGGYIAVLDALSRLYAPELGLIALPIGGALELQADLLWSTRSSIGTHAEHFAEGLVSALDMSRTGKPEASLR